MIFGIGIDMVEVERMEKSLDRFGHDFAEKILSVSEFQEFKNKKKQGHYLAKRFAAKEAFVKALGTGLRDGLSLKQIEVQNNELGKPEIRCHEKANEFINQNNITKIFLSLTDEQNYAAAVVLLEI